MGREITQTSYSGADRTRYRAKVAQCLDALEVMLARGHFAEDVASTGLEIELALVTESGSPANANAEVLAEIADPSYQSELGRYTIELNVEPRVLSGTALTDLEADLRATLNHARDRARALGTDIVMTGILPTLGPEHAERDWISDDERYLALDTAIRMARHEDISLEIAGPEPLAATFESIAVESVCTSTQLHLQVRPEQFARYWNSAQLLAGPQLVLGANSPLLFGHRLWAETRPVVFLQATDTRAPELRHQGVRPIVTFGERWITSIFDLFEENVRYYPALLPETTDDDPFEVIAAGGTPTLDELTLHNGTVYRWNRPIYAVAGGRPHLRVENRVLPAGPTVVDTVANAAFFYGAVEALVREDRPTWTRMPFSAARDNFEAAARHGIDARLSWPGELEIDGLSLIEGTLLPMARSGLASLGVDKDVAEHYLGVIAQRIERRQNGASWQVAAVSAYEAGGVTREVAIAKMLADYRRNMDTNTPVALWPVPQP
ncbi:glutamate--cysteine ligase [Georgenia sp. Z1344]|uniref:glutamate--cysteine ligase n=1 Tax=Georgenia sp. Z1344 TaxID=3416706 RepID=UPI003CF074EA